MSYKRNKYGSTTIVGGKKGNLIISYEPPVSTKYERRAYEMPVLLYTPLVGKDDNGKTKPSGYDHHYHVSLSKTEALKLRDWLNEWYKGNR